MHTGLQHDNPPPPQCRGKRRSLHPLGSPHSRDPGVPPTPQFAPNSLPAQRQTDKKDQFGGSFKDTPAPALGAHVVKAALARAGVAGERVSEVLFGNVLSAGLGQSPARQVVLGAGLPDSTEAVTINKVCASGLKAVALAAQTIQLGVSPPGGVLVAGGMENMSRVPYYLPRSTAAPATLGFGHVQLADGMIADGLWDVYNQVHMGNCAENTARTLAISRAEQDAYAIESYRRAQAAWDAGHFSREVAAFEVPAKRKGGAAEVVDRDDEYRSVRLDKIPTLRPAFQRDGGTITAANSSNLSDGASAVVLAGREVACESGARDALARIVSYADAATRPIDFPLAPTLAIPLALQRAGLGTADIARWEINEAFAAVSKAIERTLELDPAHVNVHGGAIALGHALGSSGSRILTTLLYSLQPGEFGVAAICNGGGGATAMVVQKLDRV